MQVWRHQHFSSSLINVIHMQINQHFPAKIYKNIHLLKTHFQLFNDTIINPKYYLRFPKNT